ncbi:DUF481 domain-containing protein [Coraliomargarita akajimensis]|nr:DUF481 domain-containing protein [Coraliomargarita akajimensis]
MQRSLQLRCLVVLACLCLGHFSHAVSIVTIDSGERIIGDVLAESTEETLAIQSGAFGKLTIARSRVVKIEEQLAVAAPATSPAPIAETDATPAPKPVADANAVEVSKPKPKPEPEVVLAEAPAPAQPQTAVVEPQAKTSEELQDIEQERIEKRLYNYLTGFSAPESWKGSLKVGMNVSTGDSKWNETYLRGTLEVREKGSPHLYRYAGTYIYRENERSDGSTYKSQDRYDASFLYRYNFDNDWFVQNTLVWRVDQKKGIDRDLSDMLGVGYAFNPFKTVKFNLGANAGVGQYETANETTRDGINPLVGFFEELSWKPLKRTSLVHSFRYYINPQNTYQYSFLMKTALRVRMTDLLGFEFSYNKDYDNDTGAGNNKNDTRWLNALIVYF